MILFHLIMISMIISYVILYVYIWKGENFPPIPLDQFPVHIFSVDSEILQGTQSGKLTGNITFLFLYNSLCMDTRSIIFVYGHPIHYIILYVWTPDPSYYSLCMDTRSIIFYVLLMYGHSIHSFLIYYWCMDARSIPFWAANCCHYMSKYCTFITCQRCRIIVWYNLILMDP